MTDGYIKVLMKSDPKSRRQGIKFKGNVLFLNNDKEENDIDTHIEDSTILTSKYDVNDERSSEEMKNNDEEQNDINKRFDWILKDSTIVPSKDSVNEERGCDENIDNDKISKFQKIKTKLKKTPPDEKTILRDEINKEAILARCQEVAEEQLVDADILNRGDLIVARIVWDEEKEKFHDHFAVVQTRMEVCIVVAYICDIFKKGETSQEACWPFTMLASLIKARKLRLLRFNLLDIKDDDDYVVYRAKKYRIPEDDVNVMHFAFTCAFGKKEPIFSQHHLSLCKDKSLLLLRSENDSNYILLHKSEKDLFHVSFWKGGDDDDTEEMSYEEILNIGESDNATLYFYPGIQIKSVQDLKEIEVKLKVIEGFKETIQEGLFEMSENALELSSSTAFGMAGIFECAMATNDTVKARRKEKLFAETKGLAGSSRTKANKEVAKTWSGAVVGAATGTMGAALVGQVLLPVPGVGATVGVVVGAAVAGMAGRKLAGKTSEKIFDKNIQQKCPLCILQS